MSPWYHKRNPIGYLEGAGEQETAGLFAVNSVIGSIWN